MVVIQIWLQVINCGLARHFSIKISETLRAQHNKEHKMFRFYRCLIYTVWMRVMPVTSDHHLVERVLTTCRVPRIKVDYGSDGSLESRLYLSGAGSEDSGQYSCIMPGMEAVTPAAINISITRGEETAAIQSNKATGGSPLSSPLMMIILLRALAYGCL